MWAFSGSVSSGSNHREKTVVLKVLLFPRSPDVFGATLRRTRASVYAIAGRRNAVNRAKANGETNEEEHVTVARPAILKIIA